MKTWLAFLLLLALQPVWGSELAQNNPVAIVTQVQGDATLQHGSDPPRKLYWLDLLRPEDRLSVSDGAVVVAGFFYDDHRETIRGGTQVKMAFKEVQGSGVTKAPPRDVAGHDQDIPYLLMTDLRRSQFKQTEEPGERDLEEKVLMVAHVRPDAYPPVFAWKNTGSPAYRFQLFNEWDEFLYENKSPQVGFKFPYRAPFHLTKSGLYYWQVLTPDDRVVVRKYSFRLLTQLHSRFVESQETRFHGLKAPTQSDYTEMFLMYAQYRMIDRNLHLLHEMTQVDPKNPILYRALARYYLAKGCPVLAQDALDREAALGGQDAIDEGL